MLRSWVVQYKRAGATRRITLGSAEVLGAEAARGGGQEAVGQGRPRRRPASRPDRSPGQGPTHPAGAGRGYLAAKEQADAAELRRVRRYLTSALFRATAQARVDTITRRDVAARVVVIVRECGNPTAARARGALGSFFAWAMQMGLVVYNPTIGTSHRPKRRPRPGADGRRAGRHRSGSATMISASYQAARLRRWRGPNRRHVF